MKKEFFPKFRNSPLFLDVSCQKTRAIQTQDENQTPYPNPEGSVITGDGEVNLLHFLEHEQFRKYFISFCEET